MLYTDDGMIAARTPKTLQDSIDILCGLFDRVGLRTNTDKTEAMTLLPGRIRTCLSEDAYLSRMDALQRKARNSKKVECHVCRKEFVVGALESHVATQHGLYYSQLVEERDKTGVCLPVADPQTYTAIFYQ